MPSTPSIFSKSLSILLISSSIVPKNFITLPAYLFLLISSTISLIVPLSSSVCTLFTFDWDSKSFNFLFRITTALAAASERLFIFCPNTIVLVLFIPYFLCNSLIVFNIPLVSVSSWLLSISLFISAILAPLYFLPVLIEESNKDNACVVSGVPIPLIWL